MSEAQYQQEMENYFISWDEINHDVAKMAKRLSDNGWEQIIALTEGGLVPAKMLAKDLDIPVIESISVKDRVYQRDLSILTEHFDARPKTLFIDDLVDTGKTARAVKAAFPNAHFVGIYAKKAGMDAVDDYVTEVQADHWIHFPWDLELKDTELENGSANN